MFEQNSFGKSLDLLHRSMDVSVLRSSVIADNIANADTPGFKRSEVNFESELKRALESESTPRSTGHLTDDKHIAFHRPADYRSVMPRKVLDYLSTTDNNGNNVDLERESMLQLQNQLNYQLYTQFVTNKFRIVNTVLR